MPGFTVFLGLGSNLGDRRQNLRQALDRLQEEVGRLLQTSAVYRTAPWGHTEQPAFLNQVVCLETALKPRELMERLLQIEKRMGRKRTEHMGPRIIDLDILFYGQKIIRESGLEIPHPRLEKRNFVLLPMLELAPDWVHPQSGLTIRELAARSPDTGQVSPIDEEA